jgi:hypothetical protein
MHPEIQIEVGATHALSSFISKFWSLKKSSNVARGGPSRALGSMARCSLFVSLLAFDKCAGFRSPFGAAALVNTRRGPSTPTRTIPMRATIEEAKGVALLEGYTAGATLCLKDVAVGIADNTLIRNLNWYIFIPYRLQLY